MWTPSPTSAPHCPYRKVNVAFTHIGAMLLSQNNFDFNDSNLLDVRQDHHRNSHRHSYSRPPFMLSHCD
jgi:hypothetical protein